MLYTHPIQKVRVKYVFITIIISIFSLLTKGADDYKDKREKLIKEITLNAKLTAYKTGRNAFSNKTMNVMNKVPREKFVPEKLKKYAYDNRPLPIGHGQTISQPYIVALMTDMVNPTKNAKTLEIGTGSGYQAAVISRLVKELHTIEVIPALAKSARERLKKLNYSNIIVYEGDGYYGLEKHAPFDIIIVTAAASHIPPPLIKQLKKGGRMVIPVGNPFQTQHLIVVDKDKKGKVSYSNILPVLFVPLTGEIGRASCRERVCMFV